MMASSIVDAAIDPGRMVASVAAEGCGAIVLFLGTVRDTSDGRSVTSMEYSAYRAMAERELAAIVSEVESADSGLRIAVEHRVGALALGDVSVAIAVAHPHRGPAYEASRRVIEEIKRRLPIWKREHFADGSSEWVGAGGATIGAGDA